MHVIGIDRLQLVENSTNIGSMRLKGIHTPLEKAAAARHRLRVDKAIHTPVADQRAFLKQFVFFGKDVAQLHMEGFSQDQQFTIRHAANLPLDLGDAVLADSPSEHFASGSEHGLTHLLCPAQIPDFRADDILFWRHLPILEVDASVETHLKASDIGRS